MARIVDLQRVEHQAARQQWPLVVRRWATSYEDCESQPAFGQFKPVGFDVLSGQGEQRIVKAEGGNLRHLPSTRFNEPITLLPQGQAVRVLGPSAPGWLRVRTSLGGSEVIGHVAVSRLEAAGARGGRATDCRAVAAADRAIAREQSGLTSARHRRPARFRSASWRGRRATPTPARRCASRQLQALADWLGVESSERYARSATQTFCNVYAADYCYLAEAYLPRVWWTDSALLRLGAGESGAGAAMATRCAKCAPMICSPGWSTWARASAGAACSMPRRCRTPPMPAASG